MEQVHGVDVSWMTNKVPKGNASPAATIATIPLAMPEAFCFRHHVSALTTTQYENDEAVADRS